MQTIAPSGYHLTRAGCAVAALKYARHLIAGKVVKGDAPSHLRHYEHDVASFMRGAMTERG